MNSVHFSVPVLAVLLLCMTSKCMGQLTAADASEGPCLSSTEILKYSSTSINILPNIPPGIFYVPMGSQTLYRHYAQALLGRPANNQTELDSMQLILNAGLAVTTIVNTGFPHMPNPPQFLQLCATATPPDVLNPGLISGQLNAAAQTVCVGGTAVRPDGSVTIKAPSTSSMDSFIWANADTSVALVYRCADDGIKDFKVLTRSKTLSASDIGIVKQKISPLGFSVDHMMYMMYD